MKLPLPKFFAHEITALSAHISAHFAHFASPIVRANLSKMTTTTDKLNLLLEKLDIDEDVTTLFTNERITSLRKLFNLTESSLAELESKVDTAAAKSDIAYIGRFIKSHQHLQVNGTTPIYYNMNVDHIEANIIIYEKYLQEKESASGSSLPSLNVGSHRSELIIQDARSLSLLT